MALPRYKNKDFLGTPEKGKEPKRYNNFQEMNRLTGGKQTSVDDASPQLLQKITERENLRYRFGIIRDKNGRIPDADGIPRIFIMGKGADGHDTMLSLDEAGVSYGSREFWKQSQLGNVFAYPAGETKPVQMRLELHGTAPNMYYGKLIEAKDMPQPPKTRPGFFQRMLHSINKNWASRETRDYFATLDDGKAVEKQLKEAEAVRETSVKEEMEVLRDHEEDLQVAEEKAEFRQHVQKTRDTYQAKLNGHQPYRDMTAPEPVFDKTLEKTGSQKGLYTKAGFSKLEKIDAKVSDFQVGGEPLSDDAYMGLVAACSLDPKNGENMYKASREYHPNLVESLEPLGVTKEEFLGRYPENHSDFVFGDFLDRSEIRDGEENQFEAVVNPGRKDAVKLLQDYKNNVPGSKKALAEAIVRGVKTVGKLTGKEKKTISDQHLKSGRIMNAAAGLLEKDPELKTLAVKECGLEENDLKAVQGLAAIDKADLEAAEAEKKIAESALNGTKLTGQEKKKLAVDVISARIMKEMYLREVNLGLRKNKEFLAVDKEVEKLQETAAMESLLAPPTPDRPLPPKGKLYMDQISSYANIGKNACLKPGKTVLNLANNGVKDYRKLAERITELRMMDKLNERNLSEDLQGPELNGPDLMAQSKTAADDFRRQERLEKQPVAEQAQEQKQEQDLDENLNINAEIEKIM